MKMSTSAHDGVGPVVCQALPMKVNLNWVSRVLSSKGPDIIDPAVPERFLKYADDRQVEGYDTTLGFLAKRNPECLDYLDDPIVAMADEHDALAAQCRDRGLKILETDAPSALRERGITRTVAFPVEILEAYLL